MLARALGTLIDTGQTEHVAHPFGGQISVPEESGPVGEPEDRRQVGDRARALEPPNHLEVGLEPVEESEERDPGLLEARGRGENMARQLDRRLYPCSEATDITPVQRLRPARPAVKGSRCAT